MDEIRVLNLNDLNFHQKSLLECQIWFTVSMHKTYTNKFERILQKNHCWRKVKICIMVHCISVDLEISYLALVYTEHLNQSCYFFWHVLYYPAYNSMGPFVDRFDIFDFLKRALHPFITPNTVILLDWRLKPIRFYVG